MKRWKKWAIGTGVTTAVGVSAGYMMRLNRLAKELQVLPSAMVHKVNLNGVVVRLDITLKNPTNTQLRMNYPFVKMGFKQTVVGTSMVKNMGVKIEKNSQTTLAPMYIEVPLAGAFSLGMELLRAVQSGEGVKVEVTTLTTLDFRVKKFPYKSVESITLKKQANG